MVRFLGHAVWSQGQRQFIDQTRVGLLLDGQIDRWLQDTEDARGLSFLPVPLRAEQCQSDFRACILRDRIQGHHGFVCDSQVTGGEMASNDPYQRFALLFACSIPYFGGLFKAILSDVEIAIGGDEPVSKCIPMFLGWFPIDGPSDRWIARRPLDFEQGA